MKRDLTEDVVFRVWGNEIIVLWPAQAADAWGRYCNSYMHVGQHGSAAYSYIIKHSRPAFAHEYADLRDELTQRGYRCRVIQRATPRHHAFRWGSCNA